MEEGRTGGAQQDGGYVTVGEAAKLLGVHRNTIHNRIKAGRIRAHKVVEADREVYRIERSSLGARRTSADVHTLDAQRTTAGEALAEMIAARLDEIVRDHAEQLGAVREQLGAERARREIAEEKAIALEEELRALRAARESPRTPAEGPEGVGERSSTEGPQEGSGRRSWWRRWFGFE